MGMVHATQKGELKDPSPEVARAAKSMKPQDAKDFASTKHKGLPKKKDQEPKTTKEAAIHLPTADALLRHVGLGPVGLADPLAKKRTVVAPILDGEHVKHAVDRSTASVLDDLTPGWLSSEIRTKTAQSIARYRHKLAAATIGGAAGAEQFAGFVLPDGSRLEPLATMPAVGHERRHSGFPLPDGSRLELQHKTAAAMPAAPMPAVPMPATQMPAVGHERRHLPPRSLSGAPAGSGLPQTGLPPTPQKAPAMPGTPGHAATNVIDQRGGLDPMGRTVDGNNAAGVAKGLKMAGWFREKDARRCESSHSDESDVSTLWIDPQPPFSDLIVATTLWIDSQLHQEAAINVNALRAPIAWQDPAGNRTAGQISCGGKG